MSATKTVVECYLERHNKAGKPVYTIILDDGSEGTSMTKFKVGDKAKYIFDEKWQCAKIIRLDKDN